MTHSAVTQPCSYYRQGRCVRGATCKFSHSENGTTLPVASVQNHYQPQVNDQLSTNILAVCEFYKQGSCRFGDGCRFFHPRPPAALPQSTVPVEIRSPDLEITSTRPFASCKFYAQGRCNKGEACPFPHTSARISASSNVSSASPNGLDISASSAFQTRTVPYSNKSASNGTCPEPCGTLVPCRFFRQGRCSKGTGCLFLHPSKLSGHGVDSNTSSEIALDIALLVLKAPDDRSHPKLRTPQQGIASNDVVPEDDDADDAQTEENEPTTTRVKFGCKIIYGPGASVQDVVTPFESYCVILHNLPSSVTHAQLIDHAEPFGRLRSLVVIPARDGQSPLSARIEYLDTAHAARAAAEISQQAELRGISARLDLRAAESGSAVLRSTKAKLSWFSPSLAAWAHYNSLSQARKEATRLDGMTFNKNTIRASFQTPSRNQSTSFSVALKGLPLSTSSLPGRLKRFCNATSVTLGSPSFVVEDSVRGLRTLLASFGPLEAFDFIQPEQHKAKLVAFVQFADPSAAESAAAAMHGQRQSFLRGSQTFLELIHSIKYMLPFPQFEALRSNIDALRDALQTCKLRYHDKGEDGRDAERVCLRAYGPDAKALGRLKAELELMLNGDVVLDELDQVVWHEHFVTASGGQFLVSVAAQTKAYVKSDARTRTIHLFGSQVGRAAAKARIVAIVEKLRAQEHLVELDADASRRMLHGGFQELQAAFSDKILFDVVRKRLVLRGDEADVRAIRDAIARQLQAQQPVRIALVSSSEEASCPVCSCEATDPIDLPCGHSYCRACLQHFLRSLGQSTGGVQAVAACLRETPSPDGSPRACGRGIPLQTVRSLLSPGEEERLLEATFLSHIHSLPQEFRYCPTADCQTIYRTSTDYTLLRCPSCVSRICASCHVEFHEGLSCAEFKDNESGGNESFQRWREEHGIKACPGCGADLEKNGGCNHMKCARCGTHMCWVCMKMFTDMDSSGGVYAHMRREHGGI